MKMTRPLLSCLILTIVIAGAASAQYREIDWRRVTTAKLTTVQLTWLRNYLHEQTGREINDSIFIRYSFNRSDCWFRMDEKETEDQIKGRISRNNIYQEGLRKSRPSASVFFIREPGNKFNKIIQLDTSILIDHHKELGGLLFKKKKTACGNSAVILPDGRVILTKDESHFLALYYTKEQIEQVLKKE